MYEGGNMKTGKKFIIGFIAVFLLFGTVGCIAEQRTGNVPEVSEPEDVVVISVGTVGADASKYIKRFQPTADYIALKLSDDEVKYQGKVTITETPEEMIELLSEQKIDLYMESPFTAALVAKESDAVPILRRWKEDVAEYHAVFIVKKNSTINTLDDFKGKTIAFQDPESTSGYLLPKAHLVQRGYEVSYKEPDKILPDESISYVFTGDDENTAFWITEGKADIGAVSNIDLHDDAPEAIRDQLRVVDRTIDVPRHIVSHRSGMDPVLADRIKQILLDMDEDPKGILILEEFKNTKKYDEIPDKEELFANINKMLEILG
jgi:phosphonate transport system substrate-binding protein